MNFFLRKVSVATLAALLVMTVVTIPALAQTQTGGTISSPAINAALSGPVTVTGSATHPTFRKWQADLLLDGDPGRATFLALGETPVDAGGELFAWDTTRYPNGQHILRLRVVHSNLNYDETFAPVIIVNAGAPTAEKAQIEGSEETKTEPAAEVKATPDATPVVFRSDAQADGKRWIAIDISDQSLTAWQGDVPVFETTVSTGKPGYRTLPGAFSVYRKYEETRMRRADYDTPDVPWTMYYDGGFAVHGAYWHNNFGTPVSHGCVNLRVPEAKALFEWADVGTEIVVTE